AAVVEGDEAAREYRPRLDRLQLGLRRLAAEEEVRPEGAGAVAAAEEVDVPDVVGLEHGDERRRPRVEPRPDLAPLGRREWVEQRHLPARLDARRGDERRPAGVLRPGGVLDLPEPEPRRDVPRRVRHGTNRARFVRGTAGRRAG